MSNIYCLFNGRNSQNKLKYYGYLHEGYIIEINNISRYMPLKSNNLQIHSSDAKISKNKLLYTSDNQFLIETI